MISETHYTRNFSVIEFASKDGLDPHKRMSPEFMTRLQALRDIWTYPLTVTSGIRSLEHNEAVGGSENSFHLKGMAADLDVSQLFGDERWDFIALCFNLQFPGIGISKEFIHLDMRKFNSATWVY